MSNIKKRLDLFLIPLAVACQFFSCAGLYFMKYYATSLGPLNSITLATLVNTFLFGWFAFSFIGRVCGAYGIGKYANKVNFFTLIRQITIGHIFVALLVATVCITGEDFYRAYQSFYLARFLYSALMPVTIVLPAIYLFSRYPDSQHIQISAYIAFATFLGKFLAHILVSYVPTPQKQIWYWLPVLASFVSLGLYTYLQKLSPIVIKKTEMIIKYSSTLIHKKILAFIIGAACNAGITYYYSFLTPYLANIVIVKSYGLIKGQPPFYIAFGLFLLPAIKICQKFGVFKTMVISLACIFILGIAIPYMNISDSVYIVLQIVFAFFLAGLVTPSLAVVYKLLKDTHNIFDNIFWVSFGSSVAMLFLAIGSRIGFILHYPLTGMWIFAANILICLLGIFAYVRFEKNFSRSLKGVHPNTIESYTVIIPSIRPN